MDILSFFYVELGVQIVSMLGTKSYELVQIGEERKSLGRLRRCGFSTSGLAFGIWLFRLKRPMLYQLS